MGDSNFPTCPENEPFIVIPARSEVRVSFLIPAKNQVAHLAACLLALRDGIDPQTAYEVIVVLNAATDEVRSFLQERTRGIHILESPVNRGVAGGYNRARSAARGDFLALIHDDTEIQPGWVESLLLTLDSRPDIGAVGSLILRPDGTPLSAGSVLWKNAHTCPPWLPGSSMPEKFRLLRPVDYCGTCGLLVRRTVWDAIGGMDEALYPAYYVDVDFCMAVRQRGYAVFCNGQAELVHHVGSSSSQRQRVFLMTENRGYFVRKWQNELADFEPKLQVDANALERAHANTALRAENLSRQIPASGRSPSPAPQADASYLQRELAVAKKYAEHLTATIEEYESAHLRMKQRISELKELALTRKTEIARLESLARELSTLRKSLREDPGFVARHLGKSLLRSLQPGSRSPEP